MTLLLTAGCAKSLTTIEALTVPLKLACSQEVCLYSSVVDIAEMIGLNPVEVLRVSLLQLVKCLM